MTDEAETFHRQDQPPEEESRNAATVADLARQAMDSGQIQNIHSENHANDEGLVLFIPEGTREQSRQYALALADMWDLHLRKAAGYSGHSPDVWANFRTMVALGVPDELGVYIRMNDKFNRLKSLAQDPRRDLVNEPIEDLLRDIAAYSIIALRLRAEQKDPMW